jgi:2-polyprenyl-6-methoxyphenol hydroxylase-like FAD-dependent oxidoreductase
MAKASVAKQPVKAAASVPKQPAKVTAAGKPPAKAGAAPVSKSPLTAAVIGGSVAGLMASLVLHKQNFEVTLYEEQETYDRSIQWSVRQSFIDYLSSVDEAIAEYVQKELVRPITNGYRYLSDSTLMYPDGSYTHADPKKASKGSGVAPTKSCRESLKDAAVGIMRAKKFETYLREQLKTKVKVEIKLAPNLVDVDGSYALSAGKGQCPTPYDLIVVCVGGGWFRRDFRPINYKPVSRERAQVAGEVNLPRNGMIINYQHAKKANKVKDLPTGELLYSALLSTDETATNCWVIGDVSADFVTTVGEAPKDKRNDLVKEECGKIAARTMLETDERVLKAGVRGVEDETVKMFSSQAKISSVACAGDNLVLAGDAVGAGHWAVGGGMHVAGVCHQKRLDTLATDLLNNKKDRQVALKDYSDGVLEDTMAWISKSMEYYYLSIPKEVVDDVFKDVMEDFKMANFKKDNSFNAPDEIQKRIVSLYFGPKTRKTPKEAGFTDEL